MEWINVTDKLPETNSQHGEDFVSDKVGVWTDEGFDCDRYLRIYDLKGGTGRLKEERWMYNENVMYWMQPREPK